MSKTYLSMTKILILICLISMSTCTIIPILQGLFGLFGGLGGHQNSHQTNNYQQDNTKYKPDPPVQPTPQPQPQVIVHQQPQQIIYQQPSVIRQPPIIIRDQPNQVFVKGNNQYRKSCFGSPVGNYVFKIYNSLLPQLPFQIDQNSFTFTGCNTISIPIQINNDGTIQISNKITSTLKKCDIDNDNDYINAITFADGYGIDGNNFFLTTQGFRYLDFIFNHVNFNVLPSNFVPVNQQQPQIIIVNPPQRNIRPPPPQPPRQNCFSPQAAFTSTGPDYGDKGSVNTKFGLVRIMEINRPRPAGYRILEYSEGKQIKSELSSIMQQWSIVAFNCNGKLDGSGYGNKFMDTRGPECGQVFIVRQ